MPNAIRPSLFMPLSTFSVEFAEMGEYNENMKEIFVIPVKVTRRNAMNPSGGHVLAIIGSSPSDVSLQ